ncbi:class I SAM-dependent methyltransferase [Palleronia sp. LCG004]|uniref:class I SAM-dependent methyltransferase n=1 Tax=Palleronia sp. LCG004 TaxID=3079304 RepID=UPI002941FF6B|nr:class I SAM-dependent methyltransferase [Palleronia sp. LCG004]WOI58224.1 class I SAM-dependent methyltransferase [Palleronia sp. LCG004]
MGFSPDWLALRDPADRAARDRALLQRAATAAGPAPLVVDLGCGTGATWRALAPLLPEGTRWRLVDNDPALLEIAKANVGATADCVVADLAGIDALPLQGATLITASALLDLMPEAWLSAFAARVQAPFYAALSYDGRMEWAPPDDRDGAVTAAFNRHQRGDKGLGPALGPDAADRAEAHFTARGFAVHRADSPWRIGPDMAALQRELTHGIAMAAGETGLPDAERWGRDRDDAADRTSCIVGHVDFLALPPPRPEETPDVRH